MARGCGAACSTSACCWWCRRCRCRLPSRRCPVTPQCAFVSTAATVAGRGCLALLDGGKAAVGSIKGEHTPRIILSARSSWKPVVEHDHANGEERQSHCLKLANAARWPEHNYSAGLYQRPIGGRHGPTWGGVMGGAVPKGHSRGGELTHDKPAAGTEESLDVCQANRAAPLSVNFT